jgi:hypothetical protein
VFSLLESVAAGECDLVVWFISYLAMVLLVFSIQVLYLLMIFFLLFSIDFNNIVMVMCIHAGKMFASRTGEEDTDIICG